MTGGFDPHHFVGASLKPTPQSNYTMQDMRTISRFEKLRPWKRVPQDCPQFDEEIVTLRTREGAYNRMLASTAAELWESIHADYQLYRTEPRDILPLLAEASM